MQENSNIMRAEKGNNHTSDENMLELRDTWEIKIRFTW